MTKVLLNILLNFISNTLLKFSRQFYFYFLYKNDLDTIGLGPGYNIGVVFLF